MRVGVIVTAAGSGTRLGAQLPKALVPVAGRSLLEHALVRAFDVADEIVVTAPESHVREFTEIAVQIPLRLPAVSSTPRPALGAAHDETSQRPEIIVVTGGATRQDSVRAGLAALSGVDLVLVHDAARAFAPTELFQSVVRALEAGRAAVIPALPVVDTIKRADAGRRVTGTVDRSELWAVQTPQGFRREALERAHAEGGAGATDDAALIEALGEDVYLIDGAEDAFKVTTPRDLAVAEAMMTRGGPHD